MNAGIGISGKAGTILAGGSHMLNGRFFDELIECEDIIPRDTKNVVEPKLMEAGEE
jgi:hypothetical protein